MSEIKLQKLMAINEKLRQEELLERIPISKASQTLLEYTRSLSDPLVKPTSENPFNKKASNGRCVLI